MDIDNENHWGGDYFTTHFKTPGSRALRDSEGRDRSKILFVNDIDKDGSGTPDYMDGWGCPTTQIPLLEREQAGGGHRAQNTENRFVPMSVTLANIPSDSDVRIRFNYPESPPETLQRERLGVEWYPVPPVNFEVERLKLYNSTPTYKVASPAGKIRIWKKDGSSQRNAAADYVRSGQTVMTRSDLQGVNGTLYLEAVNPSADWSDIRIVVSLSVDGGSTWVSSSAVRVTAMRCNFTVGVVRQFTINALGQRMLFMPNHTTPSESLADGMDAVVETLKNGGGGNGDEWWHDGDAVLGHGFAFFQYEGPNIDEVNSPLNSLYKVCCNTQAGRDRDGKYYFGKTGGNPLSFWDSCAGGRNDQRKLTWWDICPYKIEGKSLVLKKSYTLHPRRMNALFDAFHADGDQTQYNTFGLHIIPALNSWGCLSHVGLILNDWQLDDTTINQCIFDKVAPSTANKSVWRVINGREQWMKDNGNNKQRYTFAKEAIDILRQANAGKQWGQTISLSDPSFITMTNRLFTLCNGKQIKRTDKTTVTVQTVADLDLDNTVEPLRFYDPGYFPSVFGELPPSVFDVREN